MTRIVMLTGSAFEIDSHRDAVKYYDAAHIKPFYVGSLLQTIADVLDLEWIVEKEAATFNGDEKVRRDDDDIVLAGRKLPDMRELIDLRRLGEIGYVRGIREKLSDIASQSPDYRWLVDRLEPMSRDLDFPQYIAVLSELIEQRVMKSRETVLIVDDSVESLNFLTDALEDAGFTVLVALNGLTAMTLVDRVAPDIVLMDAVMPGLDGFETCRRLKASASYIDLPVIFMTGLCETEDIIRGFEAGGVDYVTKPVIPDELLPRIQRHLATAQSVRSARTALDLDRALSDRRRQHRAHGLEYAAGDPSAQGDL